MFHWEIFLSLIPAHSGRDPSWWFQWVLKGDVIRLPGWSCVKSLGPRECALCRATFAWWWGEQASFTLAWTRPLKQLTPWLLVRRAASITYKTWKCVPSRGWIGGRGAGGVSSHFVTPITFSHPSSSCPLPVHNLHPCWQKQLIQTQWDVYFYCYFLFCFVLSIFFYFYQGFTDTTFLQNE